MIKALSVYDEEKVKSVTKKEQKKSLVLSIVLSVLLVAAGVWNVVMAFSKNKINVLSLIVGIIACALAVLPIVTTLSTGKKNTDASIKDMGVDKEPVTYEYEFKDKRIEVKRTQGDEVTARTIMFKTVTLLRLQKNGLSFYVGDNEMYYLADDEITYGDRNQLINLFRKNGIAIKKR